MSAGVLLKVYGDWLCIADDEIDKLRVRWVI